jgi:hypothetical protein
MLDAWRKKIKAREPNVDYLHSHRLLPNRAIKNCIIVR